jgi:hypothetical protein
VYTEWATENMQVHYSASHRWYYLPDQTVDEVLIFKSADSSPARVQGKQQTCQCGESEKYSCLHS